MNRRLRALMVVVIAVVTGTVVVPAAAALAEARGATVSVFNGPDPVVRVLDSADEEAAVVGHWLTACAADGVTPGEMSVFVRSDAELPRARAAVTRGCPSRCSART